MMLQTIWLKYPIAFFCVWIQDNLFDLDFMKTKLGLEFYCASQASNEVYVFTSFFDILTTEIKLRFGTTTRHSAPHAHPP